VSALLLVLGLGSALTAQTTVKDSIPAPAVKPAASASSTTPKWYDKLSLRGYAQFRYNRLLETNPDLKCEQCDRSIGSGQTFSFRRARLIFSGDVHERLFVYIQFDYSADASSTNKHFLQVRDAYFDFAFDKKKEFRLRFGQSKIPFGFENMQSSSNRIPLDRSDALNSGAPNERDMGVFFMWAPKKKRDFFAHTANAKYKGSGDYGVFAAGLYSGQGTNRPELNDHLHAVARLSYPIKIGKQTIEPGIQGYSGFFTLPKENMSQGVEVVSDATFIDKRLAGTFVWYAEPFGVLAEYNVGKSPGYFADKDSIGVRNLKGGFVTLNYRTHVKGMQVIPYARYQAYDGPKKAELDARWHRVREWEFGVEWAIIRNIELTLGYVISHRHTADQRNKTYDEQGNMLRIQVQANY
jgi:hypothetical protein